MPRKNDEPDDVDVEDQDAAEDDGQDGPEHEHYEPLTPIEVVCERIREVGRTSERNPTASVKVFRVTEGAIRPAFLTEWKGLSLDSIASIERKVLDTFRGGEFELEWRVNGQITQRHTISVGDVSAVEDEPAKAEPVPAGPTPEVLALREELARAERREKRRRREAREAKEKAAADAIAALTAEVKSLRDRPATVAAVAPQGPSPDVALMRDQNSATLKALEAERAERRAEEKARDAKAREGLEAQLERERLAREKDARIQRKRLAKFKAKLAREKREAAESSPTSPLKKLASTIGEVVELQASMASLKAVGGDDAEWGDMFEDLKKPIREALGQFAKSVLDNVRGRIGQEKSKPGEPEKKQEDPRGFAQWVHAMWKDPTRAVNEDAIREAMQKWPALFARLCAVSDRASLRALVVLLTGGPMDLDAQPDDVVTGILQIVAAARNTAVALSQPAPSPATETANEAKPAAAEQPPPAPPISPEAAAGGGAA